MLFIIINMASNTLKINVSGRQYETYTHTLTKYMKTRLGKIACELEGLKSKEEGISLVKNEEINFDKNGNIFFDRPFAPFEAILEYYQTGELHIPSNLCPKSFLKELEFWKIDAECMQHCCRFRYLASLDDYETLTDFYTILQVS